MSTAINNQLPTLRVQSANHLHPVAIAHIQDNNLASALIKPVLIANANWGVRPIAGADSLLNPQNRQSSRKVKTLSAVHVNITNQLNTALLPGESYPVLTAILGVAVGVVSGGASLLFTISTTALSIANTSQRVLARTDDEIWHVEEIGKVGNKAIYISSYFIVDPYRKQSNSKGWLIHEDRKEVVLS